MYLCKYYFGKRKIDLSIIEIEYLGLITYPRRKKNAFYSFFLTYTVLIMNNKGIFFSHSVNRTHLSMSMTIKQRMAEIEVILTPFYTNINI